MPNYQDVNAHISYKGNIKMEGEFAVPTIQDLETAPESDNAIGVYNGKLYAWDSEAGTWQPVGDDKTPDYVNDITRDEINSWNGKISPYSTPAYYFQTYLYTKSWEVPNVSGIKDLSVTVNGTQGSTSFTASGVNLSSFTGMAFPVVIFDGTRYYTYYCYGITSGGAGTLSTPLRSTVSNGTLKTVHDSYNGQHLTDYGYRALADGLFDTFAFSALKNNALIFQPELIPATTPFTLISGTLTGGYVPGTTDLPNFASVQASTQNAAQLGSHIYLIQQGGTGLGVTWTASLGAKSGYFETYIGLLKKTYNTGSGSAQTAGSVVVTVTIDGVQALQQTIATYNGQRIVVPFTGATSIIVSIVTGDGTPTAIAMNRTGFYITNRNTTDGLFSKDDKIVFLGDSWTQYQSNNQDMTTRFKDRFQAIGGDPAKVINSGRSGMTSVWGRYWFQQLVLDLQPTVAVIEFFTNDNNSIPYVGQSAKTDWNFGSDLPTSTNTDVDGKTTAAGWLDNITWMVSQCIANGIQPIIYMPAHTASQAQTQSCFDNLLPLAGTGQYYDIKAGYMSSVQASSVTAQTVNGTSSVVTPLISGVQKISGGSATTGGFPVIETLETNSGTAKGVVIRPDGFRQYTGSSGHLLTVQNGTGTAYSDVWWVDNAANTHMRGLWLSEGIRAGIKYKTAAFTFDETYFAVYCNIGTNTSLPLGKASDYPGKIYYIKNVGTGNFLLSITPNGSDTINGCPAICIPSYGDCVGIMSDGVSNWIVISITTKPYEIVIPAGEDGTQTHSSTALQGTFWLERRGTGSLRTSEWSQASGGGFTLTTSGDVLHAGEIFFAHFY